MRIVLTRYLGVYSAKSTFEVWLEGAATPALVCEAREARFKDYAAKFPKCSDFCLPTGVFKLKAKATRYSPMTLVVQDAVGHKGCAIGYDTLKQHVYGDILIGRGRDTDNPLLCRLTDQRATFDKLQRLVYGAFATGEEITLEVRNEVKEPTEEEWKEWREWPLSPCPPQTLSPNPLP